MLLPCVLRSFAARWSHRSLRRSLIECQKRHIADWASREHETVELAVGGNGHVNLEISSPAEPSTNKILLYLPPGPFPEQTATAGHESLKLSHLPKTFEKASIIAVNYRLGPRFATHDHRFPTPIHDVFSAWDYVIDPEAPHNSRFGQDENGYLEPKICLYGSHIGGALALTLALTNPQAIHALAIRDPLVDWTALDEFATGSTAQTSSRKSKSWFQSADYLESRTRAARSLVKLRTSLFRTPSGYFDNFASPTLFLRAPGRDTPLTRTAAPEVQEQNEFATFEGEEIRYGDDEDEVGWVESKEDSFGPYDDDYHALSSDDDSSSDMPSLQTDSSTSDMDWTNVVIAGKVLQTSTDLSFWTPREKAGKAGSTKRRKVLKRWPPIAQPEEVMLPFVQIYLREPQPSLAKGVENVDISTITYAEGIELQELLRRACFWGKEKGVGEERVNTTIVTSDSSSEEAALQWLKDKL